MAEDWRERIVATADTLGGKPRIKGTRISVDLILELLAAGMTQEEILVNYDHLISEDIVAATNYPPHRR